MNPIVKLRRKRKWDQWKMAMRAGVTQSAQSKIERGVMKPSIEYLANLMRTKTINTRELLYILRSYRTL